MRSSIDEITEILRVKTVGGGVPDRAVLDDREELIAVYDLDLKVVYVNSAMCRSLEYSAEELIGRSILEYFNEDYCEEVRKRISDLGASSPYYKLQHRIVTSSGEVKWIEGINSAIFDSNGNVSGYLAVGRDITDQIKMELALKTSDRKFRNLFRLMSSGFCLARIEGARSERVRDLVIEEINPACEEMIGVSNDEAAGRRITEVLPGFENQSVDWLGLLCRIARSEPGTSEKFEGRSETLGGWYKGSAYCPEPGYCAITFHDITEQVESKRKLVKEKGNLKKLLQQEKALSRVAARMNTSHSMGERLSEVFEIMGRALGAESACYRDFECDPEDMEYRFCTTRISSGEEFCCKICRVKGDAKIIDALGEKGIIKFRHKFYGSDCDDIGERKCAKQSHLLVALRVADSLRGFVRFSKRLPGKWSRKEVKFVQTFADILAGFLARSDYYSKLIELEQSRSEAVRTLERAARLASIGEMTAGITHEIFQPLSVIKLSAESIDYWDQKNENDLPEIVRRRIDNIADATRRIQQIIQQMKDYGTSETIRDSETFTVGEALRDALSLLQTQIASHGISLDCDFNSVSLGVRGSKIQFEQAVINLVVNAVDALDEVDAPEKKIFIRAFAEDDLAVVEISDNGPGLPGDFEKKIFEPFFTTKGEGKGTGLGLAIVKRFVEVSGGILHAGNSTGGGAEFTIKLPLVGQDEAVPERINENTAG